MTSQKNTFILMRHAQSAHNYAKTNYKKNFKDKSYKQTTNYKDFRFRSDLIDLKQINQLQCLKAQEQLKNLNQINLIITSPLKRCLQTCKQLIQGKSQIKVIVEPFLSSRLASAWAIGSDAETLSLQYPEFDFSRFKGQEFSWMFKILRKKEIIIEEQDDADWEKMQEFIRKSLFQGKFQNYFDLLERSQALKKHLKKHLQDHKKIIEDKKQILIISHACLMKSLVCKQTDHIGKANDGRQFKHCKPQTFRYHEIINQHSFEPKL